MKYFNWNGQSSIELNIVQDRRRRVIAACTDCKKCRLEWGRISGLLPGRRISAVPFFHTHTHIHKRMCVLPARMSFYIRYERKTKRDRRTIGHFERELLLTQLHRSLLLVRDPTVIVDALENRDKKLRSIGIFRTFTRHG